MNEEQFLALAAKIEHLSSYCEQLQSDNSSLHKIQDEWALERSHLLQKNDLAKNKIEAMIGRLRALEQK